MEEKQIMNLTASDARNSVISHKMCELHRILECIRIYSIAGETYYITYDELSISTLIELKSRGFTITGRSFLYKLFGLDNYYKISWG